MGKFYLTIYNKTTLRLVLNDISEVFPVLPDYWPWYDESVQDYMVGMDEDSISDSYWTSVGGLTDAAVALYGIAESERVKYYRGLIMQVARRDVPASYYVINESTGVLTYSAPAISAQRKHLEAAFLAGDPDVDLTGGPNGEPLVDAEPSITVRVRKLYSDDSVVTTATDTITLIPSRGRSGILTGILVAGVYDFTFELPIETGPVSIEVRSTESDTNVGWLNFYRNAPP